MIMNAVLITVSVLCYCFHVCTKLHCVDSYRLSTSCDTE